MLNAANEVAVEAFLAGRIRFTDIHTVNANTLDTLRVPQGADASVESLLALDAQARSHATARVQALTR